MNEGAHPGVGDLVDTAVQPRAGRGTKGEFRFQHCAFAVTTVRSSTRSKGLLRPRGEMPIPET